MIATISKKLPVVLFVFSVIFLLNCTVYGDPPTHGFHHDGTYTGPDGDGVVDVLYNDEGDMWLLWWRDDGTFKQVYVGARDTGITGVKEAQKPSQQDIEDALRRHGSTKMVLPPEVSAFVKRHLSGHILDPIWNPADEVRGAPGASGSGEKPTPGSVKGQARKGHHSSKDSLGKNNTLAPPSQPGFGGMGTRDDTHPERVNPVPQMRTMEHNQKIATPGLSLSASSKSMLPKTTVSDLLVEIPRITAPSSNAVFSVGQKVYLKIAKKIPSQWRWICYEVEYREMGSHDGYHQVTRGGRDTSKTKNISIDLEIEAFNLVTSGRTRIAGEYRVRAACPKKGTWPDSGWSKWIYIKIIDKFQQPSISLIRQRPVLPKEGIRLPSEDGNSAASVHSGNDMAKIRQQDKQEEKVMKHLVVMPVTSSVRPGEPVRIVVTNTAFRRLPFEVRFRTSMAEGYKVISHPRHSFSRKNGKTSLILHLSKPGRYQVRFRANSKASWTPWQSFQVVGKYIRTVMPTSSIHIGSGSARAINPQPEPPGKELQVRTMRKQDGILNQRSPRQKQVRQLQLAPAIKIPGNGKKFLMTGTSMHIKAEISHASEQKIQVEVQREKQHRYLSVKNKIRIHQMKKKSSVDMLITDTGTYRLRVKEAGNGTHWGKWTSFYVYKVVKNMPTPSLKKPASQIRKHPSANPAMERLSTPISLRPKG